MSSRASSPGAARIAVEQVSVRLPSPTGTLMTVLSEVSLDLEAGGITCIVGPSGCGKTTLLNLLAGFLKPSAGRVLANGRAIDGVGPDRLVVFQRPAVFPWLTVHDNVVFGIRHQGASADECERRAHAMLTATGLSGFENYYPYQLSGGMLQRVQIARCLVCAPSVLLLDEPFGALDAQTRFSMQELLVSVWLEVRPTVIFITHDVEEALFLADRVVVLTPRPGQVHDIVTSPWPHPRSIETLADPEFGRLKSRILNALHTSLRPPT